MASNQKTRKDDRRGGGAEGVAGNPKHEYSDELAEKIEHLAGCGTRQSDIGIVLDISEDTIQRHYKDAFAKGHAKAGIKLNQSLFQQAMGTLNEKDDDEINPKDGFKKEPNLGAAIWLRKSQYGDKEVSRHEVASGDIHISFKEPGDAEL